MSIKTNLIDVISIRTFSHHLFVVYVCPSYIHLQKYQLSARVCGCVSSYLHKYTDILWHYINLFYISLHYVY